MSTVRATMVVAFALAALPHGGTPRAQTPPGAMPREGGPAAVPLGDVAGAVVLALPNDLENPFAGQPLAVKQGQDLFNRMNCAGCHNYDGSGGMGPNLTDHYWRYGGTPVSIYKSIWEGRPQGMPAWDAALPSDDIWKIVAFIESLGGAFHSHEYAAAREGDRPGDLVAPEAATEVAPGAATDDQAARQQTRTPAAPSP